MDGDSSVGLLGRPVDAAARGRPGDSVAREGVEIGAQERLGHSFVCARHGGLGAVLGGDALREGPALALPGRTAHGAHGLPHTRAFGRQRLQRAHELGGFGDAAAGVPHAQPGDADVALSCAGQLRLRSLCVGPLGDSCETPGPAPAHVRDGLPSVAVRGAAIVDAAGVLPRRGPHEGGETTRVCGFILVFNLALCARRCGGALGKDRHSRSKLDVSGAVAEENHRAGQNGRRHATVGFWQFRRRRELGRLPRCGGAGVGPSRVGGAHCAASGRQG
mmetsp:Transcript_93687/g.303342  ORF Transcript_93687/g.303342 Transcript_93687/m.303342 type:complete len:276 (-) Transcript_93687:561-1388(-)